MRVKSLRAEQASALTALFLLLFCNLPFWQHLLQIRQPAALGDWGFIALALAVLFLLLNLALSLLALPYLFKPVVSVLLLGTAPIAYFMNQYGVMIDRAMIRNALETNPGEAFDLLTFKMVLYVVLLAVLPLWLLWRTPIAFRPLPRELLVRSAIIGASLLAAGFIAFGYYKDFASLLRNHRELRYLLTPTNYLQAASGLLRSAKPPVLQAIGLDAKHTPGARPKFTVIVVGETARAANFSLNGYERETNPQLKQESGLINFPDFHSCGTDTATSVPCMFSMLGRANYSDEKAKSHEGLLDVLQRAGVKVSWRDNQSGCKGVCDRVTHETIDPQSVEAQCQDGECLDESLLGGLQARIDQASGDAVLVLHMMGSHGPAYYKRYPREFAVFQPECTTSQLDQCSPAQLRNSYDNSLLYTDHVLARLIQLLRQNQSGRDIAMLYLSDHGESLGEGNFYLHGAPALIAPAYQTHVPALLWLSDRYPLNAACLRDKASRRYSQDYLFHSVLGLQQVRTDLYRAELDLFAACPA